MKNPKLFKARGSMAEQYGGRKYSTYNEALNEAVTNSLDWGAKNIDITITKDFISIVDDACGMSEEVLAEEYFSYGVSVNSRKKTTNRRGMFCIGSIANEALGDELEIESHIKGEENGTYAKINWSKVKENDCGDYVPEEWQKIAGTKNYHGTKIRISKLKFKNISASEFADYIVDKHWPILIKGDQKAVIKVNGKELEPKEIEYDKKFEFDSSKEFDCYGKVVPALVDPQFGHVKGTIYLNEEFRPKDAGCSVYVKGQLIDIYKNKDWFNWNNWATCASFKSKVRLVIHVEAETGKFDGKPFTQKALMLKGDRTSFNESMKSFQELKDYIGGLGNKNILGLKHGGVLKVVHNWWLKTQKSASKEIETMKGGKVFEDLADTLNDVCKDEDFIEKTDSNAEAKDGPRKRRPKTEVSPIHTTQNRLFTCSKCQSLNRIDDLIYQTWLNMDEVAKMHFNRIPCEQCGHPIDFAKDKYNKDSSKSKPGSLLKHLNLGSGRFKEIRWDEQGREGPKASYSFGTETLFINREHSLYAYSYRKSEDAWASHLLDCAIYALAYAVSQYKDEDFFARYNYLCKKVGPALEVDLDKDNFDDMED